MRVQVLGLCRFSMLVNSAFQTTGNDLQANREILYDPQRLALRMRWFENLCLPPLLWQTDPDFTLILATGQDLPQPWLGRLREIAAAVPQIRLEEVAPDGHGAICKRLLEKHSDPAADVVAQFRLDDDDAVTLDYVQNVRDDHRLIAPLLRKTAPVAIDYTRGLVLQAQADGGFAMRCEQMRLWGLGLAMYFPADRPGSIMNYRHDWIWRMMTTVSRPDRVMWIRGLHGLNDSPRTPYKPVLVEMSDQQIDAAMLRRFGLERETLLATLADPEAAPES